MPAKKGTLEKIVEAVTETVEAVAVNVGLAEPEHKPKAVRKAARKVRVAQAEEVKKATRRARRTSQ